MRWFLLTAVASVPLCAVAAPLLTEDFETDPAGLKAKGWRLAAGAAVTAESRDGSRCLKMACPERKAYTEFFIPVEKGKMYRASAWVKCENVGRDPASGQNRGAVLFCQFANAQKGWVGGGSFPKGLHGTEGWTRLDVPYTAAIPETVAYIQLLIGIEGTGTVWFDDVRVEEITAWSDPVIVAPTTADGTEVDSLRPRLIWTADLPAESYRLQLSQSPEFPEDRTQTWMVWGGETRPPAPLTPGRWYWRVRIVSARATLPWIAVQHFVVPPDAVRWPPRFVPRWHALPSARPELDATLTPGNWVTAVTATIGGVPAHVTRDGDSVRLVPEGDLPPGVHEVTLTAQGDDGRSVTCHEIFTNKQPRTRVTRRDDGIALVNGAPFFPLGAYRDPSDTLTDFSGLERAGFNVTHSYVFEERTNASEAARKYLRAAHAAGIRVFLGFSRPAIRKGDRQQWKRWVADLMDEPALLTWYMMDEPICQNIPYAAFDEIYAAIRQCDTTRPASLLLARISPVTDVQRAYAQACDILWCDPYPLPNGSLSSVASKALACREAAGPDRPFWVVLQAHDLRYWKGRSRDFREHGGEITRPTAEETRSMAHLALSTGAHGLIWYWGPNSHYHIERDAPAVWKGLCATLAELNGLMPWLVAPRNEADSIPLPAPFRGWSRTHDGTRVLSVVNNSDKSAQLELDLPDAHQATDRDTQQKAATADGRIRATLPPWGVRILQWQE